MSTRSKIGIIRKDGTVEHVYCHWDGYIEHNGLILFNEYNNLNKVNALIKNGDMSLLAEKIYPEPDKPHGFDIDEEKQDKVCIFYNRERNEDWKHTCPRKSKNLDIFMKDCKLSDCEYAYLYDEKNANWIVSDIPYDRDTEMQFKDLKNELNKYNCEVDDSIKYDYLIFDGIELFKDLDYYEYVDNYRNDSSAYFEAKSFLNKENIYNYIYYVEEYNEKDIDQYLSEVKEFYSIDDDLEV